jgi:hypothetical protein
MEIASTGKGFPHAIKDLALLQINRSYLLIYESPLEVFSKSTTIVIIIEHSGRRPKDIPKRIAAVINLKSIEKVIKHD